MKICIHSFLLTANTIRSHSLYYPSQPYTQPHSLNPIPQLFHFPPPPHYPNTSIPTIPPIHHLFHFALALTFYFSATPPFYHLSTTPTLLLLHSTSPPRLHLHFYLPSSLHISPPTPLHLPFTPTSGPQHQPPAHRIAMAFTSPPASTLWALGSPLRYPSTVNCVRVQLSQHSALQITQPFSCQVEVSPCVLLLLLLFGWGCLLDCERTIS